MLFSLRENFTSEKFVYLESLFVRDFYEPNLDNTSLQRGFLYSFIFPFVQFLSNVGAITYTVYLVVSMLANEQQISNDERAERLST